MLATLTRMMLLAMVVGIAVGRLADKRARF